MGERLVKCLKYGKELPGLERAPFPGELGKKIFENVSLQAWQEWQEMQLKILNEYRLNMSDPNDHKAVMEQMNIFLGFKSGEEAEVENKTRADS